MSKLNGKTVVAATLHSNIFVAGLGEIKKDLLAVANGINKPAKMTIDEPFLILEMEDTKFRRLYTIPIPLTNFTHLVLESKAVTTPPLKE